MPGLDLLLTILALPVLAAAAYLALLALLARRAPPPAAASGPRFDVVVPAHDEEAGVGATVRSLLAVDYPRDLFRVVVVADNCGDHTAQAAADAGARVLVRDDPSRRGKGYALAFAFDRLGQEEFADAFVVVDADSLVSANLLGAFAARLQSGAQALQADYGVRNRDASWRTRLLHVAFTLFHGVRSRGREALSLSCGLRGNGMAFSRELLRRTPYGAFSVVEDLEYGIRLGLAGHAVRYVGEASVAGEMAAGEPASRPQRVRWEGGRRLLARRQALPLLLRALRDRSPVLFDLALDLLVPPLSLLVLATLSGLLLSATALALGHVTITAVVAWTASALALGFYMARGWRDSGVGWRGLRDLIHVPDLIAWKLALAVRAGGPGAGQWTRTPREPASNPRIGMEQEAGPTRSARTRRIAVGWAAILLLGVGLAVNLHASRKRINDFGWLWLLSRMLVTGDPAYDATAVQVASVAHLGHDVTAQRRISQMYPPATGIVLLPLGALPWTVADPLFSLACYALLLVGMYRLFKAMWPELPVEYRWLALGVVTCMASTRWAFTSHQIGPMVVFCTAEFVVALTRRRTAAALVWGVMALSFKVTLGLPMVGLPLVLRRFGLAAAICSVFAALNVVGFARAGGVAAVQAVRASQDGMLSAAIAVNAPDPRVPGSAPRLDLEFLLNGLVPAWETNRLLSHLLALALVAWVAYMAATDPDPFAERGLGLRLYVAFLSSLGLAVVYHHHYDSLVLLVPVALLLPLGPGDRFGAWRRAYLGAALLYPSIFAVSAIAWAESLSPRAGLVFKELGAFSVLLTLLASMRLLRIRKQRLTDQLPPRRSPLRLLP